MKPIFEKKDLFDLKALKIQRFNGFPPMFHPHCELIYVVKGRIPTVIDGTEHLLQAGEISILFPYLTHSYAASEDAEAIVLLFNPTATIFSRLLLTKKPQSYHTDGRPFLPILQRILSLTEQGRDKTAISYLNALIGEITDLLPLTDSDQQADDITVRILEYCSEHFTEDVTLNRIAEDLYVSTSYVSKIFANKLKYNFRDYINALRIDKAKGLLEQTDLKISDVMYECGFNNQSSFNRIFRTFCSLSPREYKNICSK